MVSPEKTALVIGFGSIGERHTRILGELGFLVTVVSRRAGISGRFHQHFQTITEALTTGSFDYAVVATETSEHENDLSVLVKSGMAKNILVEKPLYAHSPTDRNMVLPGVHIGYQLRFHPLLRRLREFIAGQNCLLANFYVGQHLDSWRAGRTGREAYSGVASKGGGVLRDLSHELDLAQWLFGDCMRVTAMGGRLSQVTADSDDAWAILGHYRECPVVSLQMNYLDRIGRRRVEVVSETATVVADLISNTLQIGNDIEQFPCDRDTPMREMHRAVFEQGGQGVCDFKDALKTMAVIDAVERAGQTAMWVTP